MTANGAWFFFFFSFFFLHIVDLPCIVSSVQQSEPVTHISALF